jgi:hypothetical protein
MTTETPSIPAPAQAGARKPWESPRIDDAAVAATAAGCVDPSNGESFSAKNGS